MKRFITKRKFNFKYKIVILLFTLILSIYISSQIITNINIESLSNNLINNSTNITSNYLAYSEIFNILDASSLIKTTISEFDKVNIKEVIKENESNINKEEDIKIKEPILYIYNTHQSEEYKSESLANYNITPTVYMLANIIKKELDKNGIYTIVEDENIKDVLNKNNWLYKDSYKASRLWLENINNKYPTIRYYLDLHRDSVSETIVIDNKRYAKMMFVLGMNHSNYEKNEEIVKKLYNYLDIKYKGIVKDTLYAKKNIFNQDFNENVFLIEIGGNENTLEEAYNSAMVLADAITSVIGA